MSSQGFREQAALTRLLWAVQAKYELTRSGNVEKDADAARACVEQENAPLRFPDYCAGTLAIEAMEQDGQATTEAPTATRVIFLDDFHTLTVSGSKYEPRWDWTEIREAMKAADELRKRGVTVTEQDETEIADFLAYYAGAQE